MYGTELGFSSNDEAGGATSAAVQSAANLGQGSGIDQEDGGGGGGGGDSGSDQQTGTNHRQSQSSSASAIGGVGGEETTGTTIGDSVTKSANSSFNTITTGVTGG